MVSSSGPARVAPPSQPSVAVALHSGTKEAISPGPVPSGPVVAIAAPSAWAALGSRAGLWATYRAILPFSLRRTHICSQVTLLACFLLVGSQMFNSLPSISLCFCPCQYKLAVLVLRWLTGYMSHISNLFTKRLWSHTLGPVSRAHCLDRLRMFQIIKT